MNPKHLDSAQLHERVRWFLQRTGTHPFPGHRAVELARAEHAVEQSTYYFSWLPTADPDTGWMTPEALADYRAGLLQLSTCWIWHSPPGSESAWPHCYLDALPHYGDIDSEAARDVRRLHEADLARVAGFGEPPVPADLDDDGRIDADQVGELERVG